MKERSKKLVRQFKRYLGAENAEEIFLRIGAALSRDPPAIPSGDDVAMIQSFPSFAAIVDSSYAEYEDRLKIAARNIEISSKELTAAYRNLENLNININAMLDSLGQGLLFFDGNGVCSPVFSKSCLDLLETDPSEKELPDVLGFSLEERKRFFSWLSVVFDGASALDFHDLKQLMPQEITNSKGGIIELDYRPMYAAQNTLTGILLIATDVTQARQAQIKLDNIKLEAQKVQQIARSRNAFHSFIWNLYSFMEMAENLAAGDISESDRGTMLRDLHTYKGQASSFCLRELSEKIHDIEMHLRRKEWGNTELLLKMEFAAIRALLEDEKEFARNLFGPDFMAQGKVRTIEVSKIHTLMDLIARNLRGEAGRKEVFSAINRDFLSMPVFHSFLSFERELARLAEQQGKPIPVCTMEGDNVPIVLSDYEGFFSSIIHFARNIVDHGLEKPDDRVACGKPREGHVRIRVEKQGNDKIRITIGDDGRGIDPALVRQKLTEERNIDTSHESDEQVIQHIFDPEFSLKKETSLISGQGIGMNALQDVVHKMGGTVTVTSDWARGRGTEVVFMLPYSI